MSQSVSPRPVLPGEGDIPDRRFDELADELFAALDAEECAAR